MASIKFEEADISFDPRFVPLGKNFSNLTPSDKETVKAKIKAQSNAKTSSAWATLGWSNDKKFAPLGEIFFSKIGNLESKSVTRDEVQNIYNFNPKARGKKFVTERYINFDRVDFGLNKSKIHISELPELRLTLFLEPDEGAIVFYQYSSLENYNDKNADVEYILPNSTGSDHNTNRDRLNYFFRLIPPGIWENDDDNTEYLIRKSSESETSFVIKVLTYKRNNLIAENLFEEGLNKLRLEAQKMSKPLIAEKYDLLKFDYKKSKFVSHEKGFKIDYSSKTLLLLHGTFASTATSFAGLFDNEHLSDSNQKDARFLQSLIKDGVYDQILAFDHPTIWHDAVTNCSWLYGFLGANKFILPVDLIGTSRGAIVCHQLASDSRNKNFTCGRVLSISGGFGVGYFNVAKGISTMLKVLKKTLPGAGPIIAMIAQFSVDFFIKLPGSRQLTPDSKRLNAIINAKPISALTSYQNIQVDWDKKLVKGWFKRTGMVLLDAIVKLILGKRHDLVVGYDPQGISPANQSRKPNHLTSSHTKNLIPDFPKEKIRPMIRGFLE